MEKRNLYVIIAIVLVAGLAFSFFGNYTGQSTLGTDKGGCIDTDGGFNIYTKGIVKYTNRDYTYADYCYEVGKGPGKYINEYYCDGGIKSDEKNCEEEGMTCVDGACVK